MPGAIPNYWLGIMALAFAVALAIWISLVFWAERHPGGRTQPPPPREVIGGMFVAKDGGRQVMPDPREPPEPTPLPPTPPVPEQRESPETPTPVETNSLSSKHVSGRKNPLRGGDWISDYLVLPDADDRPAEQTSCFTGTLVAFRIAAHLQLPEVGVGSGPVRPSVVWAVVPKAPVNEYGEPTTRQHQVGSAAGS
jgi:hypothetical protein